MANKIILVGVKAVKEATIIEANVDEQVIINSILEVQDLELQPVIGKTLLNRLKSEVEQTLTVSGYTLSTPDLTLLDDFIKPFLVYGTLVNSFVPLHFKATNKGIQKKNDSNSQLADSKELELLRSHYTSKFENYKKRLIEHLKEDEDPSTNPEANQDSTYGSTGWFLPDNDDCGFDADEYYRRYYRRF
ncbi:MAG: hypothetical protein EOO47_05025 [Flavobacterium sp.]|nr:MAG: hypothetical protein EOO47_05025 [Flavobacterium sp.]